MSNNIKTKAFWLKVESEVNNEADYLCVLSDTFRYEWSNNRENLRKIGRDFLKKTKQNPAFIADKEGGLLFDTVTGNLNGDTWVRDDFFKLRLNFIQWCIDKFD